MALLLPPLFVKTSEDELDNKAVDFLNNAFAIAKKEGVSDVHFEASDAFGLVRFRKSGELNDSLGTMPRILFDKICKKIYSRANIDEAEAKHKAVDARTSLDFSRAKEENVIDQDEYTDGRVDLRINTLPTVKGVSIVCRLLDQKNAGRNLDDIELTEEVRQSIQEIVNAPSGLVIITGPTGSGKTSTLYAILNRLNTPARKLITVEDPVEYVIPHAQQVNVDRQNTFANALRATLRQDPDILLIGEIRDYETAKIAVEAALTGHLVLSTLHTNNALASIDRLIDMGVDPVTLSQVLRGVVAQRLVNRLENPRNVDDASADHQNWLRKNGYAHEAEEAFGRSYVPALYKGRVPVIEFAKIDAEMREAISNKQLHKLLELARNQIQYESLTDAGIRLAKAGITSLEEVISISETKARTSMAGLKIGQRLLRMNYITQFQLDLMLDKQKAQPAELRMRIGELLVEHNYCSQEQIDEAMLAD